MKKIILTTAAIFAFGFANAQESSNKAYGFSKGNKFVEGVLSFKSNNDESETLKSSYSITPKFGYMVTDQIGVGAYLDFAGGKTRPYNEKFGSFGGGAFARYYFLSLGENRFCAYGELGAGYTSVENKYVDGHKTTKSQFNANLDLGMNYFITRNLAATFILANIVKINNSNPESGTLTSGSEVTIGQFNNIFAQPHFGLLYKW